MRRWIAPVVAVALAVAGCSGDPADPPPPTTAPPTTATPTTTSASTIALRPFYEHPCAMLDATQRTQLDLPPQVRESAGDWAGTCTWSDGDDVGYSLWLDLRSDPLAEAYKSRDKRDPNGDLLWPLFEPRQIRGLPAVTRAFSTAGDHCEVIVDAGNGQGISLAGSLTAALDPKLCDRLVTATEWVVDTIRR